MRNCELLPAKKENYKLARFGLRQPRRIGPEGRRLLTHQTHPRDEQRRAVSDFRKSTTILSIVPECNLIECRLLRSPNSRNNGRVSRRREYTISLEGQSLRHSGPALGGRCKWLQESIPSSRAFRSDELQTNLITNRGGNRCGVSDPFPDVGRENRAAAAESITIT